MAGKKFRNSKKGVAGDIYTGQRGSSKRRGHRPPEYSLEELREWLYSQEVFHRLYSEWVASGHLKRLKPSVDRKCDDVHYCMSNIQLMTWEENEAKGHRDVKSGKIISCQKKVLQFSKNRDFIAEYRSITVASLATDITRTSIGNACTGYSKSAGGYLWKYKEEV